MGASTEHGSTNCCTGWDLTTRESYPFTYLSVYVQCSVIVILDVLIMCVLIMFSLQF